MPKQRTKADIVAIRAAINEILTADHPQTVRQVFYRLVVRGLVQKTEVEYSQTVSRLLTEMRLAGELEWSWIVDNSRRTSVTRTFDNVADALDDSARYYRRSALRESDCYIEIWTEKDALAGILYEAASDYDVPVVSSRGIPSISQLRISFENIQDASDAGKQVYVYQFGDHDPTGCLIQSISSGRFLNGVMKKVAICRRSSESRSLRSRSSNTGYQHARLSARAIRTLGISRVKASS